MTTSTDTLLVQRNSGIPNDIARLVGARLVSASESEAGRNLAEALVKQMTGGDTISARFLHAEFFDFRPAFKLWFRTNHKPTIRGTDDGIWARIRLIRFTQRIADAERDKQLPARLLAELPGILSWAVQGCLAWQRDGLGMPTDVAKATDEYRKEMDVLGGFLADCCVVGLEHRCTAKDLYTAYTKWAEEGGERALTQKALSLRLIERGFVSAKGTGGTRMWSGLKVAGGG
jgi:putative DNA primase/helicase